MTDILELVSPFLLHQIKQAGYTIIPRLANDVMLDHARVASVAVNFLVQGDPPRQPKVQERILLSAAYNAMVEVGELKL